MTRNEHLEWAKERAKKEPTAALKWMSFVNDMQKHHALRDHIALDLGVALGIPTGSAMEADKFIDGFN